MPAFSLSIDIGHLIPAASPLSGDLFPHLAQAVQRVAETAQARWKAYALGAPLPGGQAISPRSGTYARSIQLATLGDFQAEVFSDLIYASALEEGMPARDLKRMLYTSNKVRISKAGRRYLVIPLRWGTPGTTGFQNVMSQETYDLWRGGALRASSIQGRYKVPSVNVPGRTVTRFKYLWGSRLSDEAASTRHEAGMVNFRKPNARGGAAHSRFLTFRVISENSPSAAWMSPAIPGKYPARTVSEQLTPIAEQVFQRAVEEDVKRLLGARTA